METPRNLIEDTIVKAEKIIRHFRNPVLLASFGKDSLVMVHLLRHLNLPIICHRTPGDSHKWEFADKIIKDWNLTVYDYPPEHIQLAERDGEIDLFSGYVSGKKSRRDIIQHFDKSKIHDLQGRVRCGLRECYGRPRGGMHHPWDLALAAQKDGDKDRYYGTMSVDRDVQQVAEGCSTFFPMRHWSDADVWEYILNQGIEFSVERYEHDFTFENQSNGGMKEREDKTYNPDWIQACTACMNRFNDTRVYCPLINAEVDNVSGQLDYLEPPLPV